MARYDDQEYAAILAAAQLRGLSPTSFVAAAALSTAQGNPDSPLARAALTELMQAREQVRRIGQNINQVARILNAGGETPIWLDRALAVSSRALERVDAAADHVTRALGGYR